MSFFCISCHVTRTLFTGSSRATNQLLRGKDVCRIRIVRNLSFTTSVVVSVPPADYFKGVSSSNVKLLSEYYPINTVLWRRPNLTKKDKSAFQLLPSRKRQWFCTKADTKSQEEGKLRKNEEMDEDEDFIRRFTATTSGTNSSTSSLEETLTEEERQILKELEEEERRFREKSDDDYYIWDGSFEQTGDINKLSGSMSEGHRPFQNQQRIIQDVIEEMWEPLPEQIEEEEEPQYFPRGKTGVFDLDELVDLLREEKAIELVVISIPPEIDYADHMVIVTVSNNKYLVALADFVRKRFKMKERKRSDKLPALDKSVKHRGWIALDLGNIILQIFLQEQRDYYDLEMLWTVGPLFDDLMNAKDTEIVQLLNSLK